MSNCPEDRLSMAPFRVFRFILRRRTPNAKGRHDKVGVTAAPMGRLFLGRPRVRSGGWDLGNLSRGLSILTIA